MGRWGDEGTGGCGDEGTGDMRTGGCRDREIQGQGDTPALLPKAPLKIKR